MQKAERWRLHVEPRLLGVEQPSLGVLQLLLSGQSGWLPVERSLLEFQPLPLWGQRSLLPVERWPLGGQLLPLDAERRPLSIGERGPGKGKTT